MQTTTRALAPTLLGTQSRTVQEVVLVLGGTLALIIAAKVQVPFYPVPMTLQTLAVMAIAEKKRVLAERFPRHVSRVLDDKLRARFGEMIKLPRSKMGG